MNRKAVFLIFMSVFAGLNLGSIRKVEDPIRDTQTDPILYEQKKEEEKDGKKGPLLYNVKNNPHESFFIDPPFEKEKKNASREAVFEGTTSSAGTSSWWEEQPTGSRAVAPEASVSAPLLETEKAPGDQVPEPSATIKESENAQSGKGDDYWW
jgi:hypothetical protein